MIFLFLSFNLLSVVILLTTSSVASNLFLHNLNGFPGKSSGLDAKAVGSVGGIINGFNNLVNKKTTQSETVTLPGLSQFLASIGSVKEVKPFANFKADPLNIYSMEGHPLFQNPAGCPPGCAHSECTFLGCPRCRKGLYLYNYNRIYICVNQCPDGFKITDGACTTGKPTLVGYIGDKKDLRDVYFPMSDTQTQWREDGRCGHEYPVAGTTGPSQCDPQGEDPCCSVHGWCGRTKEHCACVGCKDYSGKKGSFFKGDDGWGLEAEKKLTLATKAPITLDAVVEENQKEKKRI